MKKHLANAPLTKSRTRATVLAVVAAALFVTILHTIGLLRPVEIVTSQLLLPIQSAANRVSTGVSNQISSLTSLGKITQENARLESEVQDLKRQLASMREIRRENDLLRNQLNFNSRQSLDLAPARVVGYSPDNVREYLTIDLGAKSGARVGMAIVSNGALVGVIDSVADYSSRVFLLSDVDFRIRAIGQDNRANGIVAGQIGSGYRMDKIVQGEVIKKGESVITAGSGLVPKGLLIGTVDSVESSDNAVFQEANIRPSTDLSRLEIVFVVKGKK